ncbi:hypothetical protein [Nocardia sp. NPDC057353]|uniref:hypothetical protein n=1 Tax=Nocardia sp. NPDC057353 TaxID=3346104 RepID=UPI0036386AE3
MLGTAIRWLAEAPCGRRHILLTPVRPWGDPLLRRYAADGSVGIGSGLGIAPGPVLCVGPSLGLLAEARRLADGTRLAVVDWTVPPVHGWAAATGALDLATGIAAPPPPAAAYAALEELLLIGFTGAEPALRRRRTRATDLLARAGFDLHYVQTYLVARGLDATATYGAARFFRPPVWSPRW